MSEPMSRTAKIERKTSETEVTLALDLDGGEVAARDRGRLPRPHARAARPPRPPRPAVEATGDLETGAHHTVEDVGIALGQALDEALGDRAGIRRYGYTRGADGRGAGRCARSTSPDGPSAGSRPSCRRSRSPASTPSWPRSSSAPSPTNAKLTLHLGTRYGSNAHHMIEACFKAFARALREAVSIDPDEPGVPSTKGTLTE